MGVWRQSRVTPDIPNSGGYEPAQTFHGEDRNPWDPSKEHREPEVHPPILLVGHTGTSHGRKGFDFAGKAQAFGQHQDAATIAGERVTFPPCRRDASPRV